MAMDSGVEVYDLPVVRVTGPIHNTMRNKIQIIQNILGAKARVAVLREVIGSPGITARQVAETGGMSWGAIRPAVEALRKQGVIVRREGRWANGLFINENHIMAEPIMRLFKHESEILRRFACRAWENLKGAGISLTSVLVSPQNGTVVVVSDKKRGREFTALAREAGELGIELKVVSASVFNLESGSMPQDLTVVRGDAPPFSTVDDGLKFFGI